MCTRSRSIRRPARFQIVAYGSVNDIGRVVSPAIVRGQIQGGAMRGIGQALCERVVYDADSGQALTAQRLLRALPRDFDPSPLA
jgi:aerobic carbon-monoxide dehydrogenase large subunit